MTGTRTHLTLSFDAAAVGEVAELRHTYDPAMAATVGPHVTVAYPEEFTDLELLMTRARTIAERTCPFVLIGTGFVTEGDDGEGGVFIDLDDPTGSWTELRRQLLAPPFAPIGVRPHMTIVHPRTSNLGPLAWERLGSQSLSCQIVATELSLTVTSPSSKREALERLPFASTSRAICVGVLPRGG